MIRFPCLIKKTKAPGTAAFTVTLSALGCDKKDEIGDVVLAGQVSSAGVVKPMAGHTCAIANGTITITPASNKQAADDVYTLLLTVAPAESTVTGTAV